MERVKRGYAVIVTDSETSRVITYKAFRFRMSARAFASKWCNGFPFTSAEIVTA